MSELSKVTRADREIADQEWIVRFLQCAPNGTLSTAALVDDQPQAFNSTLLFVYDAARHAIYLHTARRGRVFANIQANPRACFSAFEMGRLLPADTALNFSVEYASVVAFGSLHLVDDLQESEAALQLLLDKYFPLQRPGQHYRPITPGERDATAVYRLEISEWSAKRKQVAEDFPGAFRFEELNK
jgi:nitroimidazol reductase NimA-like FMN-containing flavoprotein (pyridoxamine 5'-phosphate oxidase superfamily)